MSDIKSRCLVEAEKIARHCGRDTEVKCIADAFYNWYQIGRSDELSGNKESDLTPEWHGGGNDA